MRESYDYGLKTTISRIKDNFSRLTHKSLILISHSEERKFEIIGHLQQMIPQVAQAHYESREKHYPT